MQWKHFGYSEDGVRLARRALAADLRDLLQLGRLDVNHLPVVVEQLVRANLLAPLRRLRLRERPIPEVDAEERRLLSALLSDAERYGRQISNGRRVTARPASRRPTAEVLSDVVAVALPDRR